MANAVTKLATLTPNGVAVATFNSIPQTYDDIKIIASCKTDSTNSNQNRAYSRLYYQFNNDTSFNYNSHYLYVDGASTIGVETFVGGTGTNNMYLSAAPTSYNSGTNGWGSFEMDIFGYSIATSVNPTYLGKPHRVRNCYDFASASTAYGGAQIANNNYGIITGTNTAISRIDFKTIWGNYKAGTTFTLYGIKNT
jgi:hypothetical protein